jgi:cytochrome c biogenesis protein CcmG/thiol:disulfide interchange protein DsbE
MTLRQQWLTVLGIVLGLAVLLGIGAFTMRDELFPIEVGSAAPQFAARAVETPTTVRTLADYRGKVIVLNIWATWCAPCIYEMPSFARLRTTVPDSGLAIVAVSVDELVGGDSVSAFAKNLGVNFDVLLDSTATIARDYQVTGYPETFVIAKDGTIRKKWIGPLAWDSPTNVAFINGLLGK